MRKVDNKTFIDANFILDRLKWQLRIRVEAEFAKRLGVGHTTLSTWRKRNAFRVNVLHSKIESLGLSAEHFIYDGARYSHALKDLPGLKNRIDDYLTMSELSLPIMASQLQAKEHQLNFLQFFDYHSQAPLTRDTVADIGFSFPELSPSYLVYGTPPILYSHYEDEEGNINDRFMKVLRVLGLSQSEAAEIVGVTRAAIGNIKNSRQRPSTRIIEALLNKFPEINLDYLMNGHGSVLRSNATILGNLPRQKGLQVGSSAVPGSVPLLEAPGTMPAPPQGLKVVPFFEQSVSAGIVDQFEQSGNQPAVYLVIPGFETCDLACRVTGESMHPEINNGDIIVCEELKNKTYIRWGEIYLVLYDDTRAVKRLFDSGNPDMVLLRSTNELYPPFEIASNSIRKIYAVRARIQSIS